jgi:hypothetical protein
MRKAVTAGIAGVASYLRERPQVALFGLGVILFAGGLASVVAGQLSPNQERQGVGTSPQSPADSGQVRVGPALDEPVRPYIQGRKALLTRRATQSPGTPTLGMIVFGSYRPVSDVDALLKSRGLDPVAVKLRVPLPVFRPVEVVLGGKTLAAAASEHRASIRREGEALDDIVREAEDPQFKAVYKKDLDFHRQAIQTLEDDPAVIFAVVVRTTYSNLARIDDLPQVRYVDIPEDPSASLSMLSFAAPVPEDTETAGFALK